MDVKLDSAEFRRVLGHYPTGVCMVTAMSSGKPVGMIAGSFTSVSLDPPLVAFLPDLKSKTWPVIVAAGRFCVNVLSERQRDVCRKLSARADNKFQTVSYRFLNASLPILNGIVAWIDCALYAVHEAGDHAIAIGKVRALDVEHTDPSLLFLKRAYGSFALSRGEA